MKIQWGMMMTDGRGKLGGQVASKNRAGAYVRTKVTPSNPQTQSQSVVRSVLAILSKRWSGTLTEGQRMAWVEASASGQWDKSDVFGNSRKPSGFNLFVGMNGLQYSVGASELTTPPPKVEFLVGTSLSLNAVAESPGAVTALFQLESGTSAPGTRIQIQATAPVSPGKNYVKNLFRDISFQAISSAGAPIDLSTVYEGKFGSLAGNEGKKIFIRVRQVVAGQATPWMSQSAIIQEATP